MIEVFGKDGRVFRFQIGTPDDVIKATIDSHYSAIKIDGEVQSPNVGPVSSASANMASDAPLPQELMTASQPIAAAQMQSPRQEQQFERPAQSAPETVQQSVRYEGPNPAPAENAMKFALMAGAAALGVLVVFGVLWLSGVLGGKSNPTQQTSAQASASSSYQATPQPDMRQALVTTQIRREANSNSSVLKELAAGATVDVLGEQTFAGVNWVRVRADQTTSDVGYVIGSHLAAMGTTAPSVAVLPGAGGTTGASVLAVPPIGRAVGVQGQIIPSPQSQSAQMPTTTYYVVSRQLNVRASASPEAVRVGKLNFGTPLLADAQSNYQGRIWLRVRANNGVSGWINSDLVALTPAGAPVDEVSYAPPPQGRYVTPPQNYNGSVAREYSKGDAVYVTALNANVRTEPSARGGNDTVIDVAPNGDGFNIERIARGGGKTWYRVTTGKGITGWISSDTVQVE